MKTKFLFVVLCVVVKGQNYAYQGRADHVPVIKDGVPVDTPEVQAAKAAHFEAYERARVLAARNPSNGQYVESQKYKQPQVQQVQQYQTQEYQPQQYQAQQYQPQQYQPQQYQPQQSYQQQNLFQQSNEFYSQPKQQYAIASFSSDLPIDTPEVQQARAAHLTALSQAQNHHYRLRRSIFAYSTAIEETPEVQLAKYQHLLAHASAHEKDDDDYYHSPSEDFYHIPIITKKGVPVNTASVKAARQQHLVAHELEKAGVKYSGGFSVGIPVLTPNGVPFDTPEVYVAKAQHLAAHAEESTKHNQWGLHEGYGGGFGF